jgi:hypothetical protein
VDPVYGFAVLAVLVIAFIAARRAARRSRRSLENYRRRRRRSAMMPEVTITGSPRSDMRSYDDPTTVMDALRSNSRPWEGEAPANDGPRSATRRTK